MVKVIKDKSRQTFQQSKTPTSNIMFALIEKPSVNSLY